MITLDSNSRDKLDRQLRLWREERLFRGRYWTVAMTQEDVDGLEARINQLYADIASLNSEYRHFVELWEHGDN